ERGLARREGLQMILTDAGAEAVVRLSQAREDSLAELLGDWWGPERPTDLVTLVHELTAEVSGSTRERPNSPTPPRDHEAHLRRDEREAHSRALDGQADHGHRDDHGRHHPPV
ncbi:hypothetical protein B5180_40600, partial [Streptomyces sp. BF-3]